MCRPATPYIISILFSHIANLLPSVALLSAIAIIRLSKPPIMKVSNLDTINCCSCCL